MASEILAEINGLVHAEAAGSPDAHTQLLKAVRKLQVSIETPIETTSRVNFQILQNICSRVALEKGFYRALTSKHCEEVRAKELAKAGEIDESLVVRIMRVLVSIGFVAEADENVYVANDVTRLKATEGGVGAEKHHFDLDMCMGGYLVPYMREHPISQFGEFASNPTLFNYAHGTPTIFGLLDKNAEQKQSFDDYMASKRPAAQQQWFDIYPAKERLLDVHDRGDAALIVDIGGGPGQELIGFQNACPDVRGRMIL